MNFSGINTGGAVENTRDLSIGKHPDLIDRRWPTHVHHWTYGEFERFLSENRYPPNTWRDRQEFRRQRAIKHLLKGAFVPHEVLLEDGTIAADAGTRLEAAESWARFNEELAKTSARFEMFIGYTTSHDAYANGIEALLLGTLKQREPLGATQMYVEHHEWELSISVADARRETTGRFGPHGDGIPKHVTVFNGRNTLGITALHSVDWNVVEVALTNLLLAEKVTLDDIWFLTGVGWQPLRPIQLQSAASSQAMPVKSKSKPSGPSL